jgi:hypothetical protein
MAGIDMYELSVLLGCAAPTGTIALDPTFGSFTLLELVSLVKVFRPFRLELDAF